MTKLCHFRLTAAHATLCAAKTGDVTANRRLVTCPDCIRLFTPEYAEVVEAQRRESERKLVAFCNAREGVRFGDSLDPVDVGAFARDLAIESLECGVCDGECGGEEAHGPAVDFRIEDQGTIVTFEAVSDAAKDFVQHHIHVEPWQWCGSNGVTKFAADHRPAQGLIFVLEVEEAFALEGR